MSENETSSKPDLVYTLTLPLDSDGFFRRRCESCGLDFKMPAPADKLADPLAHSFGRAEQEIGDAPPLEASAALTSDVITCPYCGHQAAGKDMLTDELYRHLRQSVLREVARPMIEKMLSEAFSGFGKSLSGGGLLKVTMTQTEQVRSVRPLIGPEPDDMVRVDTMCCGGSMKILEDWVEQGSIRCAKCGAVVLTA